MATVSSKSAWYQWPPLCLFPLLEYALLLSGVNMLSVSCTVSLINADEIKHSEAAIRDKQ
jgi:hypothetical protein